LLPVPGLDGYGVIRPFLPTALQARLAPIEPLAILALIAMVFFLPGASGLLWGAALGLTDLTGVDTDQIGRGLAAFRFWR
ncbi:MAG TPA: site-2 protease family protein, partial [Caulobacter sp.]|nr:site-2 protease family protein [Caulobacter sp.]